MVALTSLVKDKREYIDFFLIKNGRNFFKVDPKKNRKFLLFLIIMYHINKLFAKETEDFNLVLNIIFCC